jgi:uncharacterized protein YnzC (UPF0291/DUF896 family)
MHRVKAAVELDEHEINLLSELCGDMLDQVMHRWSPSGGRVLKDSEIETMMERVKRLAKFREKLSEAMKKALDAEIAEIEQRQKTAGLSPAGAKEESRYRANYILQDVEMVRRFLLELETRQKAGATMTEFELRSINMLNCAVKWLYSERLANAEELLRASEDELTDLLPKLYHMPPGNIRGVLLGVRDLIRKVRFPENKSPAIPKDARPGHAAPGELVYPSKKLGKEFKPCPGCGALSEEDCKCELEQEEDAPEATEDNPVWMNDSIQFPRFISALRTVGSFDYDKLGDEMDLNPEEIERIVNRAHNKWEEIKAGMQHPEKVHNTEIEQREKEKKGAYELVTFDRLLHLVAELDRQATFDCSLGQDLADALEMSGEEFGDFLDAVGKQDELKAKQQGTKES